MRQNNKRHTLWSGTQTERTASLCLCFIFSLVASGGAQPPATNSGISGERLEDALTKYFSADSQTQSKKLVFIAAARVGPSFGLPMDDSPRSLTMIDKLANPAIRSPVPIETVDSVYDYILTFRQLPSFQYSSADKKTFKHLGKILFKRRFFLCRFIDWIADRTPPRKPSSAYLRYFELAQEVAEAKDKYIVAKKNAAGSDELSALQQSADLLEERWIKEGQKDEIESVMTQYGSLTSKNPVTTWKKIASMYKSATVNTGSYSFPKTELDPKIAAWKDGEGWEVLSVSADGGGSTQIKIKRIQIIRPWLEERVFGTLPWAWVRSAPLGQNHIVADGRGLATEMTRSKTIGLLPCQLVIATYTTGNTDWPAAGFLAGYLASVVAATPQP